MREAFYLAKYAEDAKKTKTGRVAFLGFLCDLGAFARNMLWAEHERERNVYLAKYAEGAKKTKTDRVAFLGFLCDLGVLCEKYALG